MKNAKLVYYNREDWPVITHIKENLEDVFNDYILFENIFLDELEENEKLEGDLFLILNEDYIFSLSKYIDNLGDVIAITRGVNKRQMDEIYTIQNPTDILVVNDAQLSTLQTTYALQSIGLNHINFIPYNKRLDKDSYYDHVEIALTPNAISLVPKFIEKVINVGYREIGYDTLANIMKKLEINSDLVYRNIIRRMDDIIEPNSNIKIKELLNSYLKSQMLDRVILDSKEEVLLVDNNLNLVYSNKSADIIFNIKGKNLANNVEDFLDEKVYKDIFKSDFSNKYMKINEENYAVAKSTIEIMDLIIGYCIIFKNEKNIRDLEINLKTMSIEKGHFAKYSFEDIIYKSKSMGECIRLAKKSAQTDHTILIQGESGTGKELIAQSIHNYSKRNKAPFVAINCAALSETLLESELFGYEGGAFTGAKKNGKLGLFEQANTGTIFLDEIGDISQNLQRQLLRVVQERQIMRIGSDRLIDIDVRIIVATNRNLLEEVHKNNFRSDLYYRLNVIQINIPPLRERKADILIILENKLASIYHELTHDEKKSILAYDWPGNIRELESAAYYYQTLNIFPDYISVTKSHVMSNPKEINWEVLKIINDNTDIYSGIGRAKIIDDLKNIGINIGDSKLREILSDLKEEELIDINLGRAGNMITDLGIEYLNNK